jgi:YVTN family beta-propeller protein
LKAKIRLKFKALKGEIMPISKQQLAKSICTAFVAVAAPVIAFAQPMVYVADGTNNISVVNMKTQSNISVPSPTSPAALALSPDGSKLYVVSQSDNTVSVINTSTFAIEKTLSTGFYPAAVAAGPAGYAFYVANQAGNTVSVYSTATNSLEKTIPVGLGPSAFAFGPGLLFVANQFSNDVSVISLNNFSVVKTFAVQAGPLALAVSPSGQHVYVANADANTVTVYTTSGQLVAQINGFTFPNGMAVDAANNSLYVTNGNGNSVKVVDLATNQVVKTIPVGALPSSVAVSADGTQVFVPNELGFSMTQIGASNNNVMSTFESVGIYPVAVAAR